MIKDKRAFGIKAIKHIGSIVFFLLVTIVYFSPEFFDDKTLPQHDVSQFQGSSKDIKDYYYDEGESSAWTGRMFSGMPAYQIGIWGGSPNLLNYVEAPLKALGGSTAGPVFTGMLMAYILFLILGCRIPLAIFGAIAYSLSSYNLIILGAGHVTKAWTLAYMPIVVGGMLAMYQRKLLVGGLCMAIGLALQIKSNHLQMTYYTAILCAIFYIGLVVKEIKSKEINTLLKSSGILALAVTLALLANAANIYGNYEMSKTSTRGKSELTPKSGNEHNDGLDKDYVFGWSYGKAETLSLLIPNIHGGGSANMVSPESNLFNTMKSAGYNPKDINDPTSGIRSVHYWGDQPGTSGPVYLGAVVCFLFILGVFVIRNPFKWVLLGSVVFFLFLAWGKNWEWFNDFFFFHFPLYAKFRAVSQALVIPALLIVIGAVWAIKEFFSGELTRESKLKYLYIATGIPAFICLVLWLAPEMFFTFKSIYDGRLPEELLKGVIADRKAMLSVDALRSLLYILLSSLFLLITIKKDAIKNIQSYATIGLIFLVFIDLWSVDKRYLGSDHFVTKEKQKTFEKSTADKAILQDKENFRVLNMQNTFNETLTSYYHRSIGGYHAAKLQRYQQLIENRINPELSDIISSMQTQDYEKIVETLSQSSTLNMLNTRYLIYSPQAEPLTNPYALGNAWFVESYKLVDDADAEIAALDTLNPAEMAIIDRRYEDKLNNMTFSFDPSAEIELVDYKPNRLTYKTKAEKDQLAVFSEVYYADGWNAYVDGKLTPHFATDWILRGMVVPAGEHEIVFKFEPTTYNTCKMISTVSSAILILLLLGTIVYNIRKEDGNQ